MKAIRLGCVVVAASILAACGTSSDQASTPSDQEMDSIEDITPDLSDSGSKSDRASSGVRIQGALEYGVSVQAKYLNSKYPGYTFSGKEGATIDITLRGAERQNLDTVLMLYGPKDGDSWGKHPIKTDDDGAGTKFSKVSGFVLPKTGEYLVIATCKNRYFYDKSYELLLECTDNCEDGGTDAGTAADGQTTLKGEMNIEVDYLGSQRFIPGAKEYVESYFASLGYKLHFATTKEEGSDDLVQDLAYTAEPVPELVVPDPKDKFLKSCYTNHFQHRGQKGWWYMLMADALQWSYMGWGMAHGDIFIIGNGEINLFRDAQKEAQVKIILHEFGHNLGLVHEGFDQEAASGEHSSTCNQCAMCTPSAEPIPQTTYSPACIAHIDLNAKPYVP